MNYELVVKEVRVGKYWGSVLSKPIRSENTEVFYVDNKEDFKKLLYSEVDPCDYELTDYNICKFVGWNVPPEKIEEFRKFYEFRNSLYKKMIEFVDNTTEFTFESFQIPEEYRGFNLTSENDEEKVLRYEFDIYIY